MRLKYKTQVGVVKMQYPRNCNFKSANEIGNVNTNGIAEDIGPCALKMRLPFGPTIVLSPLGGRLLNQGITQYQPLHRLGLHWLVLV